MMYFLARRVIHATVVLLLVSLALAFLLDFTPGDPAYALLGERATPEQVAQVHKDLRLDEPVLNRYVSWVGNVVQGDFGTSYRVKADVTDLIRERLPVTAELVLLALVMALVVSVPVAVYTSYKEGAVVDRLWNTASHTIISIPSFVTALALVYVFAIQLKDFPIHFPVTGWEPLSDGIGSNLHHAFLPALTLSLLLIPQFSKLLRDDMVTTLREDFILSAKAKGLPTRRILFRYALRPSSFSLVTLAAQSIGGLIGGTVVVEVLFGLPGMGQLFVNSINAKDVTAVQGIVAFIAIVYVTLNTGVDVVYGFLDPRVRTRRTA